MIEYTHQYYERYFHENYNGPLRRGCGAEECLAWASRSFQAGRWLDVGAGPCSFFWASAAPAETSSITLSDRSMTPLEITRALVRRREWPAAYQEAVRLLNKSARHLDALCEVPISVLAFDAFSEWPPLSPFHSISAFGLLGLASSSDEVSAFLFNAKRALAKDGMLFGASWIFRPSYAKRLGDRKQHLTVLPKILSDTGFGEISLSRIPLPFEQDYAEIVLFRGRR